MDFKVRLMKIDRLISEKGVVTFEELQRATGAAPATVKRDIRYMREELKAPITFPEFGADIFLLKIAQRPSETISTTENPCGSPPMNFTAW